MWGDALMDIPDIKELHDSFFNVRNTEIVPNNLDRLLIISANNPKIFERCSDELNLIDEDDLMKNLFSRFGDPIIFDRIDSSNYAELILYIFLQKLQLNKRTSSSARYNYIFYHDNIAAKIQKTFDYEKNIDKVSQDRYTFIIEFKSRIDKKFKFQNEKSTKIRLKNVINELIGEYVPTSREEEIKEFKEKAMKEYSELLIIDKENNPDFKERKNEMWLQLFIQKFFKLSGDKRKYDMYQEADRNKMGDKAVPINLYYARRMREAN